MINLNFGCCQLHINLINSKISRFRTPVNGVRNYVFLFRWKTEMIFDKDDDPLYQKQKTVIFWSNMVSVSRLRVKTIAPLFSESWSENKKMIRRKRRNVQVLQNVYDIQSHPCLLHEFHLVLNRFNYLALNHV